MSFSRCAKEGKEHFTAGPSLITTALAAFSKKDHVDCYNHYYGGPADMPEKDVTLPFACRSDENVEDYEDISKEILEGD